MKLHVPDMTCGHCTAAITASIQAADATAIVTTDLPGREVDLKTMLGSDAVLTILKTAGYEAKLC
ncbi:heavy-metal-associated domain-containing protein [Yoonia sp.]|uniref:heavy-metal-associated domain-containing protein n=1 Tax=Yoonia sp. TaxID=2212373 RepID=UPI003A4DE4A5